MSSVSDSGTSGLIIRCEGCAKAYKIYPEKLPAGVSSFPCRACGTLVPIEAMRVENTSTRTAGRILVIVEEEELGKLVQRILHQNGYEGYLANSGKEAL